MVGLLYSYLLLSSLVLLLSHYLRDVHVKPASFLCFRPFSWLTGRCVCRSLGYRYPLFRHSSTQLCPVLLQTLSHRCTHLATHMSHLLRDHRVTGCLPTTTTCGASQPLHPRPFPRQSTLQSPLGPSQGLSASLSKPSSPSPAPPERKKGRRAKAT